MENSNRIVSSNILYGDLGEFVVELVVVSFSAVRLSTLNGDAAAVYAGVVLAFPVLVVFVCWEDSSSAAGAGVVVAGGGVIFFMVVDVGSKDVVSVNDSELLPSGEEEWS